MPAALPRFCIVLGSERTGSNLLVGMLNSHPRCAIGEEIYNDTVIKNRTIPFPLKTVAQDPGMVELRERDPARFLERLFEMGKAHGCDVVGFKIFYRQAQTWIKVRDRLVAEKGVHVIHLRRRNLLRQVLSYERALKTGEWKRLAGAKPEAEPRQIELEFLYCVRHYLHFEEHARLFDTLFAEHPRLTAWYEDLVADPTRVAAQAFAFLGLEPIADLQLKYTKIGVEPLRQQLVNHDALRAHFERWLAFFD